MSDLKFGQSCSLSCNTGLTLSGTQPTCQLGSSSAGNLRNTLICIDPKLPGCDRPKASVVQNMADGLCADHTVSGGTCHFRCKPGFQLKDSSANRLTCKNSTWLAPMFGCTQSTAKSVCSTDQQQELAGISKCNGCWQQNEQIPNSGGKKCTLVFKDHMDGRGLSNETCWCVASSPNPVLCGGRYQWHTCAPE